MREQEGGKREGRRERGKERAEQEGLGREGCGCEAQIAPSQQLEELTLVLPMEYTIL